MKRQFLLLLAAALASLSVAGYALAQPAPEFRFGFAALAAQIPNTAGQPLENEHYGPNGDSLQKTSTGLMVWRKADNWTAFTDGTTTWINGPLGLQDRPNTALFPWETPAPTPTPAPTAASSGIREGVQAPDFSLKALDGSTMRLSDFRGRPVILNFFATWCPVCRDEMPTKVAVYQKYRDQGLVMLGINQRENLKTVQDFVQAGGYQWTFLMDSDGQVGSSYLINGVPNSIFVDKEGIIRYVARGGLRPEGFEYGMGRIK